MNYEGSVGSTLFSAPRMKQYRQVKQNVDVQSNDGERDRNAYKSHTDRGASCLTLSTKV